MRTKEFSYCRQVPHITRTDRCQGEVELALSRQRAGWHLRREST